MTNLNRWLANVFIERDLKSLNAIVEMMSIHIKSPSTSVNSMLEDFLVSNAKRSGV